MSVAQPALAELPTDEASSADVHPPPEPLREEMTGLTAELLGSADSGGALIRRALLGLLLSGAYGLALGARAGGLSIPIHAVGVPTALAAVGLLGLPALYIVLSLFNAPISPRRMVLSAVRGLCAAGLVLGGLAPLAALYMVSTDSPEIASTLGLFGLIIGGALGLRHMAGAVRQELRDADSATRAMAVFAQLGFGLFAVALAARIWTTSLPLLGGAS